ncbi:hypothetical protein [Pseudodesulfovibrio indicus]|nr:hypothetical protein [Pseudodesulfovibrio indicus]
MKTIKTVSGYILEPEAPSEELVLEKFIEGLPRGLVEPVSCMLKGD